MGHVNCKRNDFLLPYMVNEQWSEDKDDKESIHYHTLPQSHLQRDGSDWGAATWKVAARKQANISRRFVDCE